MRSLGGSNRTIRQRWRACIRVCGHWHQCWHWWSLNSGRARRDSPSKARYKVTSIFNIFCWQAYGTSRRSRHCDGVYRAVKDCLLSCSTWWICEPMSQCQNNGEWVWWFKCKDLLTFCNWLQLEPMQVNLITMATIGVMLVRFDSWTRYLNVSLSWCELSVVLQMAWAEVFLIYQIKSLKIWKYLGR